MMRRALAYGTLAAAGTAAWMLLEYALGLHTTHAEVGRWTGFVGIVFPVLAVVMAIRAVRRAAGVLPFARAMAQGIAVGVVFALLSAVAVWGYFAVLNPSFQAAGGPVDVGQQVVSTLLGGLAISVVASGIAAFVLRTSVRHAAVRP
jgi:hypothetical protein